MVEVVESCKRMVVVETCTLPSGKENSMVAVVESCIHMAVVETCSLPSGKESSMVEVVGSCRRKGGGGDLYSTFGEGE